MQIGKVSAQRCEQSKINRKTRRAVNWLRLRLLSVWQCKDVDLARIICQRWNSVMHVHCRERERENEQKNI